MKLTAEIKNIHPYNDVFYRSCYYNCLFSILIHFNKSIYPFLYNDIAVYDINNNIRGINLYTKWLEYKSEIELLKELGIKYECKYKSEDIITDIENSLSQKRPIILYSDSFFYNKHALYQKDHVHVCILLIGFHKKAQTYQIILNECRQEITYEQLIEFYNHYFIYFENSEFPVFNQYYPIQSSKVEHQNISDYQMYFVANAQNRSAEIYEGVSKIKTLAERMEDITAGDLVSSKENIWYMKRAKIAEKYRLQQIFPLDFFEYDLLDIIASGWQIIINNILKYELSLRYKPSVVIDKLMKIYDLENRFLDSFFRKVKNI